MANRYDVMLVNGSQTTDPITNDLYPDPLSVDWSINIFTEPPIQYQVDEVFIQKPYILSAQTPGSSASILAYDDVIRNINNISYITTVQNLSVINIPAGSDLSNIVAMRVV